MLCPKCRREDIDNDMEIRGQQWYCEKHKLYIDFPVIPPTYDQLKHQIEILETENAHLNELLDHYCPDRYMKD